MTANDDANKDLDDVIAREDPWLALAGSGRELWTDEHADEYVARLRDGRG